MQIKEQLQKILAVIFEVNPAKVGNGFSSKTIEGWDSLKQMNIIVAVEEEFKISFDEAEALLTNNYKDLLFAIESKILATGTAESYMRL
jgi:acyl carrier protein